MHISELFIHPLKSARALSPSSVVLDASGPRWDRRWMLVDGQGRFITQRQHPQMTRIAVTVDDRELTLSAAGMPDLVVPHAYWRWIKTKTPVRVWNDTVYAQCAQDHVNAWVSEVTGVRCQLAHFPDDALRQVDRQYAPVDTHTRFTDGFPVLVLSQDSLDAIASVHGRAIENRRYRGNIIVKGASPWTEEAWQRLQIGDAVLRLVKPCTRCVIPTLDPITGEADPSLWDTLQRLCTREGRVVLGMNALIEKAGTVRVDDPVTVL